VLTVENWAEIRRLHRAEGVPMKEVAHRLGVARNTVRAALASDRAPRYERVARGSVVDAFEARIRVLLGEWPRMPAPVVADRIGWGQLDLRGEGPGERGIVTMKMPQSLRIASGGRRMMLKQWR
jgi:hypothetical protein